MTTPNTAAIDGLLTSIDSTPVDSDEWRTLLDSLAIIDPVEAARAELGARHLRELVRTHPDRYTSEAAAWAS